ncbi:MAG: amylo-alpha-1,6-glucosidase, partial [Mycobacteriales bacterium]
FCISGRSGDINPGAEQGLFFRDTRFLCRWRVSVAGQQLDPLKVIVTEPFAAEFITRRPPRPGAADSTLLVIRRRYVGNGMIERITLRNVGREAAVVPAALDIDSDFAGLFDVKEGKARPRPELSRQADGDTLRLAYRSPRGSRAVTVCSAGAQVDGDRLAWQLVVPARGETTITVTASLHIDGADVPPSYRPDRPVEDSRPATDLARWRGQAPVVSSRDPRVNALLGRSAEDLGVLRIVDASHAERAVVAAGAPWFMTVFGRDSLLTSWMLLPLDASLALGTLQTLAELQGDRVDPLSEEEPGRILHEIRSGLDATATLGGGNVYYGSIDATPLFVMLLGELRRWGLARAQVDTLLPHADRALGWIERYGDRDGDGFVEYQRATDTGLVNQGWKDSFDAISFADGALAEPPIALAEVQGYVYAAYLARAHFAREAGDNDRAEHWTAKARKLRREFNRLFWLPDRGYYALALDRDKRPVDALASNMGHCLWTGIVDADKAAAVAGHLLGEDLYSGFGVRTLAVSMAAYNPMSYHNGSVWPHDNALVAAGLARYGFLPEAERIMLGLLDAADCFDSRLPELFCGFDRSDFRVPVPYPTSCSPQAWAAAAPLLLLRSLLRFDPWVPFGRVWCDPALPPGMLPLRLGGLHLAGARVSLEISERGWTLDGLPPGLELIRAPRHPLAADAPPHLTDRTQALLSSLGIQPGDGSG